MERSAKQKVIGILGGCSNVSTVEYYKFINKGVNAQLKGSEIAETVIMGMNFGRLESFVRQGRWDAIESYMSQKVEALIRAGVDVVICTSNTLHRCMEPIMRQHKVDFIHIVDPTAQAIKRQGLSKVGLFGTRPVMEMDYLKSRYRQEHGLQVISPKASEILEINQIIFDELVKGLFKESSKKSYLEILDRLVQEEKVEGLILGCTEIFLLIDQKDRPSVPMFNTTKLHCDKVVEYALSKTKGEEPFQAPISH